VGRRVVLAALTTAVVGLSGCGSSAPPAPAPSLGQTLHVPLPRSVSAARLRDSSGRTITLRSMRGKVVVLSDLLTLCQETCPLDTANIVAAARRAEAVGLGGRVVFLSVTVDPQRDTPQRLRAYRELFRPAPQDWLTLTGTPATLRAFWTRLGVFVRREPDQPPLPRDWLTGQPLHYDVTHSDAVIFVDQHGAERFLLLGSPHVAAGASVPPVLKRFLTEKGRRNLMQPRADAWTLPQELSVISWLVGRAM
jgi:protein SCO1/2